MICALAWTDGGRRVCARVCMHGMLCLSGRKLVKRGRSDLSTATADKSIFFQLHCHVFHCDCVYNMLECINLYVVMCVSVLR